MSAHELEFLARFDGRPAVERGPGGPGESGCYWVTKDGAHVQVFAALPEACTFLGPDAFALCRRVGWTNKDLIEQLERREPIEHLEDASWEPTRPLLRENLLDVQ